MRHVPTHAAPLRDDPPPSGGVLGSVVLAVVAVVALVVTAGTTLVLTGVVGAPDPQPRLAAPPAPQALATPAAAPSPPLAPPPTPEATTPETPPGGATSRSRRAWARDLVGAWHAERARAWSAVDEAALRALYVAGAPTGEADVARLRRWEESGWRVAGQRTEIEGVRVESVGRARLRLRVRDRLTRAVAVDEHGVRRRLDGPAEAQDRTWRMRREGGRWLLVSTT